MQITLYGHTNWTLITHIAGPLAIFFRFHSAACIFDVFHTSYREPKPKKHYYKSSTGSTHKVSTGSAHKMSTASAHKISTGSAGQGQPQGQFPNMTAVPIQTQQQQQIPIVPLQAAVAVPANQNHVFTANQLAMNYAVGGKNRMIINQSCKELIYCYNNFTNIYYNSINHYNNNIVQSKDRGFTETSI